MKLTEYSSINLMKAANGVVIRPDDQAYRGTATAVSEMLVFDSVEPFLEWAKEFFPKPQEPA